MPYTKKLCYVATGSWAVLGFTRGMHWYDYNHARRKSQMKFNPPEPYLYTTRVAHGIMGAGIYLFPAFIVVTLPKELYRFEVALRGMDEEKSSPYYNELFY